jgi:hypothetical protein
MIGKYILKAFPAHVEQIDLPVIALTYQHLVSSQLQIDQTVVLKLNFVCGIGLIILKGIAIEFLQSVPGCHP